MVLKICEDEKLSHVSIKITSYKRLFYSTSKKTGYIVSHDNPTIVSLKKKTAILVDSKKTFDTFSEPR